MAHNDKPVVITFRADQHLADLLAQLPDKSAFIRKAILSHFYQACPICKGRGVVPDNLAKWVTEQMTSAHTVACDCCDYQFPESTVAAAPDSKHFLCDHCQTHEHDH